MDIRCPECGTSVAIVGERSSSGGSRRGDATGTRDGALLGAILGGPGGAVLGAGVGGMTDAARAATGDRRASDDSMRRYVCAACQHEFTAAG